MELSSATEYYALPRPETFPALIGRALEQRLGQPLRVFNAGMSGDSSAHLLARLTLQVVPLEVDLAVLTQPHRCDSVPSFAEPPYDGMRLAVGPCSRRLVNSPG